MVAMKRKKGKGEGAGAGQNGKSKQSNSESESSLSFPKFNRRILYLSVTLMVFAILAEVSKNFGIKVVGDDTFQGINQTMTPNKIMWSSKINTKRKLLLASHQNLVWYDIDGDKAHVLNDEQQVYYGLFPGENSTVWVVTSKLNIKGMKAKADQILNIDLESGTILKTKPIKSVFTHDAVLSHDRSKAFLADTARGNIDTYTFPGLDFTGSLTLFTNRDHINTLAPTDVGSLWVMLLNKNGKSYMVEVDVESEKVICTLHNVGEDVHGLVKISEDYFLSLSSSDVELIKIRIPRNCKNGMHMKADKTVLWKYEQSLVSKALKPKFLKGLAVLDNVAYFAMSDYQPSREARMNAKCALLAFDLRHGALLWTREQVGSKGLTNVIAAPHLSFDSTYKAQFTVSKPKTKAISYDVSCFRSYMRDLEAARHYGQAFGMTGKGIFFIELPLRFDVNKLRVETKRLEDKYGWTFRRDVNNYFILLITRLGEETDQSNHGPFYPVPGRLEYTPYIRKVFDSFQSIIGRSRFMKLKAGQTITRHYDITDHIQQGKASIPGGYWGRRFRVHIPIISDQTVVFHADDSSGSAKIHMKEGYAYLFDNSIFHSVTNPAKTDRVHLIFDTIGSVDLFRLVQRSKIFVSGSKAMRFYDSSNEEIMEERIESTSGEKYDLVYENWTDSAVFSPMNPSKVKSFIADYIGGSVSTPHLRDLLLEFPSRWQNRCYKHWLAVAKKPRREVDMELREAEVRCKETAQQLLENILQNEKCSYTNKGSVLGIKTSSSLATIVESFVRMLFYECTGTDVYKHYYIEGPPCQIKRNVFMDELRGTFL